MELDSKKFLLDRFKVVPKELQNYIASSGLSRKIELVGKKYRLNEEQLAGLENEALLTLLVLDSTDSLHLNIEDSLGLSPEVSENLALDVIDYILKPVDQYMAHTQQELLNPSEVQDPATKPYSSVVTTPSIPAFSEVKTSKLPESSVLNENELITKENILSQIENPPRTIVKKYVLEHEPITDTEHLIDDTIDHRLKLESHYND